MAHPFIILGGIIVTVATATFGAIQMPGWIDSAEESSARTELKNIVAAQQLALNEERGYLRAYELSEFARDHGFALGTTKFDGCVTINQSGPKGTAFAAVVRSEAGGYLAAVGKPSGFNGKVGVGSRPDEAIEDAGGLPDDTIVPVQSGGCSPVTLADGESSNGFNTVAAIVP